MKLDFEPVEALEGKTVPSPNFQIGDIKWDVAYYSRTPDLQDFRQYFNAHCASLAGVEAANCISENLVKSVPFGSPLNDAFSENYSPADDLHRHLIGEAGHCVTYSALSADMLLSAGIPAMLVQIQSVANGGHNVISVWDQKFGWVYFDPLNSVVIKHDGKLISALESLKLHGQVDWTFYDGKPEETRVMKEFYEPRRPFDGAVIYPEPWYYTRTGQRFAGTLFRGQGVGIGQQTLNLGISQFFLLTGMEATLTLFSVLILIVAIQKMFAFKFGTRIAVSWMKSRKSRKHRHEEQEKQSGLQAV